MFEWVEQLSDVDTNIVYDLHNIDFKVPLELNFARLIDYDTGAITDLTIVNRTYEINGESVKSCSIKKLTVPVTGTYYLYLSVVDGSFSSLIYSDGVIRYRDCYTEIQTKHKCSNEDYDWDNEALATFVRINNYSNLPVSVTYGGTTTIYTSNGEKEEAKRQVLRHGFEFAAPTGWLRMLHGIKKNSINLIRDLNNNPIPIKNIRIEDPELLKDGKYSKFTFTYEYDDYIEGSTCCDILNIDDLASPDYTGGGDCGAFAVTISESAGVLTPTPTDTPTGTLTYRWYKDGVQIATSTTLPITDAGNYKVEARVGQCVTYATYSNPDQCALFTVKVTLVNNDISAVVSNIPDGESVVYSVKKDGVEVATTLPYTAVASGTYFVHATAGPCADIKGVYVPLVVTTTSFTVSITELDGVLTAVNDATSPTYLWELETYNVDTGISSKTTIGTSQTQVLTTKGIYHVSVTESGDTRTAYYLYDTSLSVSITNISDLQDGSGVVQTIENTTGHTFDFDYQDVRWVIDRNGIVLEWVDTADPSTLTIGQYTVIDGEFRLNPIFPLEINEVITIRPV